MSISIESVISGAWQILSNLYHDAWPTVLLLLLIFLFYVVLVRALRYRRMRWLQQKYSYLEGKNAPQMTVDEAYDITMNLATLEFPSMFVCATRLGMFESYAVPSITALLSRTGHFEHEEAASLRAANTGALLTEIFFHPPGSSRNVTATTRTNFLHSGYRKNGSITNQDMLYTLALTVFDPIKWIDKFEWRKLTDLEINALAVYWKRLGETLHISYDELQSTSWRDGRHWLNELEEWMQQYEDYNIRWAESNCQVARHAVSALSLSHKTVLKAVLQDVRRQAMDLPKPSKLMRCLISAVLQIRRHLVRHFCLPRSTPVSLTGDPSTEEGHYWALNWSTHPWYIRPTVWSRYGPSAWVKRILSQPVPGDDGDRYHPEGYAPTEIGPAALRGKGHTFIETEKERLEELNSCTCPFLAARQSGRSW